MSLITEPAAEIQTIQGGQYRSREEVAIREAVEAWGRARWPGARVFHELNLDRGKNRADVAFIGTDHFALVEIKSGFDTTDRLINQTVMMRLAAPEVWIVTGQRHHEDIETLRYVLPSIGFGLALPAPPALHGPPDHIAEKATAALAAPLPKCLLSLLWVGELAAEASRHRLGVGKRDTHKALVDRLARTLSPAEQMAAVCRQLRGRETAYRADPPMREAA